MGDLLNLGLGVSEPRPEPTPGINPTLLIVLMPCGHLLRLKFEATGGELRVDGRVCGLCVIQAPKADPALDGFSEV